MQGFVVSADPRIINNDASVFPRPDEFLPQRWLEMPDASVSVGQAGYGLEPIGQPPLPKGSFHPGGIGLHMCPGTNLAYMFTRAIVADWVLTYISWPAADPSGKVPWLKIPIARLDDSYTVVIKSKPREKK